MYWDVNEDLKGYTVEFNREGIFIDNGGIKGNVFEKCGRNCEGKAIYKSNAKAKTR